MRYAALVLALFLGGCSHLWHGSSAACSASPPLSATPATADRIARLTGRFRLTQITTSFADRPRVTDLVLRVPDSITRANATRRSLGHAPRHDLRLVGTWRWSSTHPPEDAEWDAGTLYLGCRDCMDASPDHLRITAISDRGFWGTWVNFQSGILRAVDKSGSPLPDPAGYFCADYLGKAP